MSRSRTPADEVAVFKQRSAELFEKEACCPACQKARRENPMISEELKIRVADPEASGWLPPCEAHKRTRRDMAVSGMKSWVRPP